MDEGCQRIRRRLNIDGDYYPVLSEKEPAGLPWRKMGIDVSLNVQAPSESGMI